jgi:hypothetical protein
MRKRVALAIVREFLDRRREAQRLIDLVAMDFELDPQGSARKGEVHSSLAVRLDRSVSNELVVELKAAFDICQVEVRPVVRKGRHYYVGLKPRPGRTVIAPFPTTGRKQSAEHVERNRRRALEREARKRAAT